VLKVPAATAAAATPRKRRRDGTEGKVSLDISSSFSVIREPDSFTEDGVIVRAHAEERKYSQQNIICTWRVRNTPRLRDGGLEIAREDQRRLHGTE